MTRGIHWFRNDLRLHDNTALADLATRVDQWLPVFVVDPRIVSGRGSVGPRARFLLDCVRRLGRDLEERGVPLLVREGLAEDVLPKLMHETGATLLSFNEDISPFALKRDALVQRDVGRCGGEVLTRPDHVVFRPSEIRTATGGSYSVYTPYRKSWWKRWREEPRLPRRIGRLPAAIPGWSADRVPDPEELGHTTLERDIPTGGEQAARRRLKKFLTDSVWRYHEDRDRPDLDGTSRLSAHLRFGALSVRECFDQALQAARYDRTLREGVAKWLDELIWRDFYAGILEEHPRVLRRSFRSEYDAIEWNHDPEGFASWCEGRTGYPIVDAGMRQLRATGWMHNRVRMIVASFLTKDLLVDWRRGERFFFEHLVDGDPASNNGGWQWAASTGTDAQPYFRIFNPVAQGRRWDPSGDYVRRWIPELKNVPEAQVHCPWEAELFTSSYPQPVVDHAERRKLALERYRSAREQGAQA
jgi:deoxyribodipyrimidine photo-lyase